MMATKHGRTKRVDAEEFDSVRSSGLIAASLEGDDQLVSATFAADDDDIMLVTNEGRAIRFTADEVRTMGRNAKGVRGVKVDEGQVVSGLSINDANEDGSLFVVTENGFGKRTELSEYSTQGRGGKGVKTAKLSEATGRLVDAVILTGEDEEAVAMSREAQVIRIDTDDISTLGRNTKGVKVMELKEDDGVACLVSL